MRSFFFSAANQNRFVEKFNFRKESLRPAGQLNNTHLCTWVNLSLCSAYKRKCLKSVTQDRYKCNFSGKGTKLKNQKSKIASTFGPELWKKIHWTALCLNISSKDLKEKVSSFTMQRLCIDMPFVGKQCFALVW